MFWNLLPEHTIAGVQLGVSYETVLQPEHTLQVQF